MDVDWLEHALGKIDEARVHNDPFPHLYIKGIFPQPFYSRLLAYRERKGMQVLNPNRPRLIQWMGEKSTPAFWQYFRLKAEGLKFALEQKFGLKRGKSYDAQLLYDFPGYSLGPHTDIPEKTLTGLFYLPDDDKGSEYGTVLYRSELTCEGKYDHDWSDAFEKAVTIPYVRNSALFFPTHAKSWHAVEKTPIERWVISYDILR